MVGVSASVNLSLHHKVQKFSSGNGSPGWSRKKDRKTVLVWIWLGLGLGLVWVVWLYSTAVTVWLMQDAGNTVGFTMQTITTERMQRPFSHKSLDQERSRFSARLLMVGFTSLFLASFSAAGRWQQRLPVHKCSNYRWIFSLGTQQLQDNWLTQANSWSLLTVYDVSQENNGSYLTRLADLCSLSLYCIFQLIN